MGRKALISTLVVLAVVGIFFFLKANFSGDLVVKRYVLKIGRFELRWYSILIVTGIILGYTLARGYFKERGWKVEELDEALFWGVIFAIIFARLYYVSFEWDYFSKNPSEIFKIWHGGIAIHGGVFGAILGVFLYTRKKRSFTFVEALDVIAWLLPLGQAIGRWGNFFNHEAFGYPTSVPWKMFIPESNRPAEFLKFEYFHPTFLYESVWDLMVFFFLWSYLKREYEKPGEIVSLYFISYSIGRMVVENFRTDSLYLESIRIAQLVSAILILVGLFWYSRLRPEVIGWSSTKR